MNEALLLDHLAIAVPMWIDTLRGSTFDERADRAHCCAQVIAHKGDIILYRSKAKGETAEAFNRLAEGIACAAFQPGGIRAFGVVWCAEHLGAAPTTKGGQICSGCAVPG